MNAENHHWMPRIGVCVPQAIRDELFARAEKTGLTASQFVRLLLIREFEDQKP